MSTKYNFSAELSLKMPIIMAPMFLVTNMPMLKASIDTGILGVFPTLNFRKEGELDSVLSKILAYREGKTYGNIGVNLIVQKSNMLFEKHLAVCVKHKVPFYITSLGSPARVIEAAHQYGAKVYCDVTNLVHAKKCFDLGCDGFIAVGQGAGGHAGNNPLQVLIPALHKEFPNMPIVAAGGIATGEGLLSVMALGACAASIGTRFIASTEASVSAEYKNGIVNSEMDDIVLTEKISGTPCTIINTPYAQKIGYTQNWFEKFMSKNKRTRKYFKMFTQLKGMKLLGKSTLSGSYETLWCAGKSVSLINDVQPIHTIVEQISNEYTSALKDLGQ
jgi:nitronate monooxygenase